MTHFASLRILHGRLSRFGDAVRNVNRITSILNDKAGTNYKVRIGLGSQPGLIMAVHTYDDIEQIERVRTLLRTDPDIASAYRFGDGVFLHGHASEQDVMERVVVQNSDTQEWMSMMVKHCKPGMRKEAIAKGTEMAELMSRIVGHKVGFGVALTGDITRFNWWGFEPTLSALQKSLEKLYDSNDYVSTLNEAHKVFDAGSQRRSLWQLAHA